MLQRALARVGGCKAVANYCKRDGTPEGHAEGRMLCITELMLCIRAWGLHSVGRTAQGGGVCELVDLRHRRRCVHPRTETRGVCVLGVP